MNSHTGALATTKYSIITTCDAPQTLALVFSGGEGGHWSTPFFVGAAQHTAQHSQNTLSLATPFLCQEFVRKLQGRTALSSTNPTLPNSPALRGKTTITARLSPIIIHWICTMSESCHHPSVTIAYLTDDKFREHVRFPPTQLCKAKKGGENCTSVHNAESKRQRPRLVSQPVDT